MKTDIIIALTVLILAMLAFTATQGEAGSPYCDMRALWIESGGEHGWPEYEPGKDEAMNCELEGRS